MDAFDSALDYAPCAAASAKEEFILTSMQTCLLRVRIAGSEAAMRAFLAEAPVGCESPRQPDAKRDHWVIDLSIEADRIPALTAGGLQVEVLYAVAARAQRLRQRMVRGNRFAAGRPPRGIGAARARGASE